MSLINGWKWLIFVPTSCSQDKVSAKSPWWQLFRYMLVFDFCGESGSPCCRDTLLEWKKSAQNTWGDNRCFHSLKCISYTFEFRLVPRAPLRGFHSLLIPGTEPIFCCTSPLKTLLGGRMTILLPAFHLGTGTHCLFSRLLARYFSFTQLGFPRALLSVRTSPLLCHVYL